MRQWHHIEEYNFATRHFVYMYTLFASHSNVNAWQAAPQYQQMSRQQTIHSFIALINKLAHIELC